jgi:hypothetical protein
MHLSYAEINTIPIQTEIIFHMIHII